MDPRLRRNDLIFVHTWLITWWLNCVRKSPSVVPHYLRWKYGVFIQRRLNARPLERWELSVQKSIHSNLCDYPLNSRIQTAKSPQFISSAHSFKRLFSSKSSWFRFQLELKKIFDLTTITYIWSVWVVTWSMSIVSFKSLHLNATMVSI